MYFLFQIFLCVIWGCTVPRFNISLSSLKKGLEEGKEAGRYFLCMYCRSVRKSIWPRGIEV
jgi:hypothetical protein